MTNQDQSGRRFLPGRLVIIVVVVVIIVIVVIIIVLVQWTLQRQSL